MAVFPIRATHLYYCAGSTTVNIPMLQNTVLYFGEKIEGSVYLSIWGMDRKHLKLEGSAELLAFDLAMSTIRPWC